MKARPPALLVLAVLALHLLVGHEVRRLHEGWLGDKAAQPMPARLHVALVREMKLQAPAAPRSVSASPSRARPPEAAVASPAPQPSAAESGLEPTDAAASAPEAAAPAVPAPPPASSADSGPGPEWPLSTRLSYTLTGNYSGPVHGRAQVEWLRSGADYQVHLDVSLGPSFAPLVTRRMSSTGVLTPDGISPRRYDEETRLILGAPRHLTVLFLGPEVQLANGVREPALRGGQDAASQFVQLTWRFMTGREPLQTGHVVRQPLVLARRQYDWRYEVLGEETLDTPLGRLAAWHLRPSRPTQQAAAGGDLTAEVWLAPALQYLPVRLLIHQDADNFIDLLLKNAPLQEAAPESSDTNRRSPP